MQIKESIIYIYKMSKQEFTFYFENYFLQFLCYYSESTIIMLGTIQMSPKMRSLP